MSKQRFHIIKDPVHGSMKFSDQEDKWIKPFIDSPLFQRLRHIKQLGLSDYLFPGAVHTRFNHCLGCCYIGKEIANQLELPDEDKQLVMIACLLHDIGHGPFSHAFEDIFKDGSIHHEDWTPLFLEAFITHDEKDTSCKTPNNNQHHFDQGQTEHHSDSPATNQKHNNSKINTKFNHNLGFLQRYNLSNPDHPLTPEKFETIQSMIMHRPIDKPILGDIVSSQLDADRLDYLLRDSHFCGVSYGTYDLNWLLSCMTPVTVNGQQRLGITHKGTGVVEHYLMARRLMMRNIYHHKKKFALENLLIQFLRVLARDIADEPIFKRYIDSHIGQFLMAVHQYNQDVFTQNQTNKNTATLLKTSDKISNSTLTPKNPSASTNESIITSNNEELRKTQDINTQESFTDLTCDALSQDFLQNYFGLYKELNDFDVLYLIRSLAALDSDHDAIKIARRIHHRILPAIYHLDTSQYQYALEAIASNSELQSWKVQLLSLPHQSYSHNDNGIFVIDHNEPRPLSYMSSVIHAISDQTEDAYFISIDRSIVDNNAITDLLKDIENHAQEPMLHGVTG